MSDDQKSSSDDQKSIPVGQLLRVLGLFLLLSALAIFIAFLVYITPPILSINLQQFDVIAPNQTTNSANTSGIIHCELRIWNNQKRGGLDYKALNLTFYYKKQSNLSFVPIGNARIAPFRQWFSGTTKRTGEVQTAGVVWENSITAMVFKVELRTKVKFWLGRWYHLAVGAQVQVNDQGKLTKKNRDKTLTRIKSGAGKINTSSFWFWAVFGASIIFHV